MKPRKTAWEKVTELCRLSPNAALLKTGLRHFSDDALVRELQRRDALPKTTAEGVESGDLIAGHLGDTELIAECRDRDMLAINMRELKAAIDAKDWEAILQIYWES